MSKMNILPIMLMMGLPSFALAQKKGNTKTTVSLKDSVPKVEEKNPNVPKRYDEVITKKAITRSGMFRIHQIDEQYFFEIPDSLLNRDILVVNRISKAPAGLRPQVNVYAGDQVAENVIRFEKGPGHRIFMKRMVFREKSADSTGNGMYRSVLNSSLQPIVAAFPVKALGNNNDSYVLDVTSFIQTENEILHFGPDAKKGLALGAVQNDKSYIVSINTFPINVEVKVVRTYMPAAAGSTLPTTYELNSSLVLLPKVPMQPRYADARVGFFSRGIVDFDAEPQRVSTRYFATRWRLEPRPEDREKYLRGELVEPQNPIVYYVDPATPKKWVPYLIAGVNDWQVAFEQAGFKNAIKALPAPGNDSTWSIDDARHNVIVYKPSAIANASGPHVHDPRSGEIIETHINWYHNIMALVHDWYMIQAGAIDPRARTMQFDDELMGQLIRFVSSHEVGHTLGLMHNYGSSSTVPVEKLRDKKYVEAHGHTPSIMDYARFNYVAQPEDNITERGIFPRIGAYDKWAIQWGYRWMPQFSSADAETPYLNKLIIDSLNSNKQLYFGYEMDAYDPRSQSEDLGDDAVLASTYGLKNLQRILPQLSSWTRKPNEGYESLREISAQVYRQYSLYMAHVLKTVGGAYTTPKSVEQPGPVFEPVPYEKQKRAMKFLEANLWNVPAWLTSDSSFKVTGSSPEPYLSSAQFNALSRLLGSGTLNNFIRDEIRYKDRKVYTCAEFLNDMKRGVWTELYSGKGIDINRRNLQRIYIDVAFTAFRAVNEIVGRNAGNGVQLYVNPDPTRNDVSGMMRRHLLTLKKEIAAAVPQQTGLAKDHLENIIARIDKALKEGNEIPK
ncbi:MAG: zinc-dependent metalloprotease [Pseudobacter sp.]|uniref:zinc-dependent metalloprotease n=1 Tax=Pseudobacter sp. TaxID=2045420 RepID=UPI003F7F03A7